VHAAGALGLAPVVLLQMRACAQKDLEVIEKGEKKPAMAKFTALQHVSRKLTAPCLRQHARAQQMLLQRID
jgi:hypothetical protein